MAITHRPEMADAYDAPTALAVRQTATAPQSFPLRRVIEAHHDVIAPLCPPGVNVETVVAQLYAAVLKVPQIAEATPQSLIIAVSQAVQTGGVIGSDVYLLPFRNKGQWEVSFAFDYKFLASCIIQAGGARSIDAEVVRKGDTFKVVKGTTPHIIHEPAAFGGARGEILGFYAVAHLGVNTPPRFVVMSLAEVEAIRAKSKQWNPEKIKTCPEWYGQARVVHRLGKLLPKKRNARMEVLERIMDADARVDAAESVEATTLPIERPLGVSDDGEDLTYQPEDEAPQTVALDVALAHRVNKQPLGESRNSGLTAIQAWAQGKMATEGDDEGRLDFIVEACQVILDARARGEIAEPARKSKEAA